MVHDRWEILGCSGTAQDEDFLENQDAAHYGIEEAVEDNTSAGPRRRWDNGKYQG
jgi:hypothetical protein